MAIPHCFDHCSFVMCFERRWYKPSNFCLCYLCLDYLRSLLIPYDRRIFVGFVFVLLIEYPWNFNENSTVFVRSACNVGNFSFKILSSNTQQQDIFPDCLHSLLGPSLCVFTNVFSLFYYFIKGTEFLITFNSLLVYGKLIHSCMLVLYAATFLFKVSSNSLL